MRSLRKIVACVCLYVRACVWERCFFCAEHSNPPCCSFIQVIPYSWRVNKFSPLERNSRWHSNKKKGLQQYCNTYSSTKDQVSPPHIRCILNAFRAHRQITSVQTSAHCASHIPRAEFYPTIIWFIPIRWHKNGNHPVKKTWHWGKNSTSNADCCGGGGLCFVIVTDKGNNAGLR